MADRASARAIAILVGIALLLVAMAFGIHHWQANKTKALDPASTNRAHP
jgi:hypothetical protein